MQGRLCCLKISGFLIVLISLASCSSKSLLTADCHSCTEPYAWKGLAWKDLEGSWRGSYESMKSDRENPRKVRNEKSVEFRFLATDSFLKANHLDHCGILPKDAIVMNGVLWNASNDTNGKKEFDVFTPVEEGSVAYGRIQLEKVNGETMCRVLRLGRVMGTNRLALPTISFSQNDQHRTLASEGAAPETEVSVEFLRFDINTARVIESFSDNRKPASVTARERPPLMFRVYRVTSRNKANERGSEWLASDEQIFRLWRVQ